MQSKNRSTVCYNVNKIFIKKFWICYKQRNQSWDVFIFIESLLNNIMIQVCKVGNIPTSWRRFRFCKVTYPVGIQVSWDFMKLMFKFIFFESFLFWKLPRFSYFAVIFLKSKLHFQYDQSNELNTILLKNKVLKKTISKSRSSVLPLTRSPRAFGAEFPRTCR